MSFNTPFWDFFDNINDEVENFNRLLQATGFDDRVRAAPSRTKRVTQNGESNNSNDSKDSQVAKSERSIFPSLLNSPFFKSEFSIVPPVDILDNEKDYELHVSIPGAKKEDITLDFHPEKNEVVISGEINGHSDDANKNLKLQERSYGKFERRITLPSSTKFDEENIKANYNNGVLTLKVPKLENAPTSSRRIAISSSETWESGDKKAVEDAEKQKSA